MKALLLEGAKSEKMRGWNHFQLVTIEGGKVRTASFIATCGRTCAKMRGWRFCERGTWEIPGTIKPGFFAKPRPEILDELFKAGGEV